VADVHCVLILKVLDAGSSTPSLPSSLSSPPSPTTP